MDFSSFNLQENGDLFKQNYQLNDNNHGGNNNEQQSVDGSTVFFNFMDSDSTSYNAPSNNSNNNSNNVHTHQNTFTVPQLSPDGNEGSFTNSSVLSGHNPEFNMSPLQIASQPRNNNNITNTSSMLQTYHTPIQHASQSNLLEDFADEEEFFTPLVSPAMAPTYNDHAYQSLINMNNQDHIFSPLSSPALHPAQSSSVGDQSSLQQKLAFIERQQQQLRNMHNQLKPAVSKASPILGSTSTGNNTNGGYTSPLVDFAQDHTSTRMNTKKALQQKIAMSSPQFNNSPRPFAVPKSSKTMESPLALKPMTPHTSFVNRSPALKSSSNTNNNNKNGFIAPATPSLLMKLGGGNQNSSSSVPTATSPPPSASSSISLSSSSSSSAAVDNMPVLPAAMLPHEEIGAKSTLKSESSKRRRISTFSSPSLQPNDALLGSPAGPRPQQSPRALKPLISPSLQPNGKRLSTIEEETARALLTSKSNYENLKEGKAKSLGIDFSTTIQSGIENRRSAHKAAEQKRRDTLKQSFDSLRTEIIDAMVEEEIEDTNNDDAIDPAELKSTKEKDVKQMSKVVLLQHSYEYILRLKNDNRRKDEKQKKMRQELISLRKQLGLPEETEQEKKEQLMEDEEEKDRKKARLKRLQNAAAAGEEAVTMNCTVVNS